MVRKKGILAGIGLAFSPVTKQLRASGKKFVVKGEPSFAFAVVPPQQQPVARQKPIIKKQKRRRK